MHWLIYYYNWASPWKNLSSVVCEQQRHRPACAYAQSDQRLYYLLIVKYHIQAWYKRNFNVLASLCSWAGWFESHYVGNPEDRFSPDAAHIIIIEDTHFLIPAASSSDQSIWFWYFFNFSLRALSLFSNHSFSGSSSSRSSLPSISSVSLPYAVFQSSS